MMKIKYEKPTIEFEEYELETAIATGCGKVVSLGPGNDGIHDTCKEYIDELEISAYALPPMQANWYENSCECYVSAGNVTLFTS